MKKEEIIEKTKEMLNDLKQYDPMKEISLNTILQNLGISKGSFYYHFSSKDDLLYQTISPDIKKQTKYLQQQIKKLDTLKDKFFLLFEPFISDNDLRRIYLENFYMHLFFQANLKKNMNDINIFKKLHTEIKKNRKQLLLQSVKSNGIKVDKKVILLLDYIDNTVVFYCLYYKILHNKDTKNEIIAFIDMMCHMIEKQYKSK